MADVPDQYKELLATLDKMKITPKASNPQELTDWMKAFLEQQGKVKGEPGTTTPAAPHTTPYIPRISNFSGTSSVAKGDNTTYDLWRYEVRCLMNEKTHSVDAIRQAIRRSLKGEAGRVVMHLGENADIAQIIQKMDSVYGYIDEKESVMSEFYSSRQKPEEDVASWSCRLEDILDRAIKIKKVHPSEADSMLHDMLWKGLKPELKDKSHYEKEKYLTFDDLRVALRKIEKDQQLEIGASGKICKQECKQATPQESESEFGGILKQIHNRLDKIEAGGFTPSSEYGNQQKPFRRFSYYRQDNQRRGNFFRGRGRGRGFPPKHNNDTTKPQDKSQKPIICYRCKFEGHIAKGCRATKDKDGNPLN